MFKWYSGLLKSRPLVANLGSALVVMSVGDIMAQEIEFNNKEKRRSKNDDNNPLLLRRSSSSNYQKPKQQQRQSLLELLRRNNSKNNNNTSNHTTDDDSPSAECIINKPTLPSILSSLVKEVIEDFIKTIKHEIRQLDYIRTSSMVFWSVGVYTPFYIQVFKLFDKHLPKRATFATISIRVMTCFLLSIPINAIFFVYGSTVHQLLKEDVDTNEPTTEDNKNDKLSNFWNEIIVSSKRKLDAELYNTIVASGTVWIPFNFILFTFVPSHLRPLNLMVCSAFWNCYLSLVQHR